MSENSQLITAYCLKVSTVDIFPIITHFLNSSFIFHHFTFIRSNFFYHSFAYPNLLRRKVLKMELGTLLSNMNACIFNRLFTSASLADDFLENLFADIILIKWEL